MKVKKQLLYKVLILIVLGMICCFVSCSKTKDDDFIEIQYVEFTTDVSYYDFYKGISFVDKKGKSIEYTLDDSNVEYGKAGKYSVKYSVGNTKYVRYVYIYGKPEIVVKSNKISYKDATSNNFDLIINARDSFGKKLDYSCLSGFSYNSNGQLITGNQTLKFKSSDKFGNTSETEISVTVLNPVESFEINNLTIDYSTPYYSTFIGNKNVFSIYCNGERLSDSCYLTNNGYLMLTPDILISFGCGSKTLYVNFDTCSTIVNLNITDSKDLSYEVVGGIDGKEFFLDDNISLPFIRLKNASIQNADFKYFVQLDGADKREILDGHFSPLNGGEYTYYADLYRDDNFVKTVSQSFRVSHYYKKPIDLGEYIPLGFENDLSLRTDLLNINVDYVLKNNSGVLQLNGNKLIGLKEGTATLQVNINNGETITDFNIKVIDYKNTVGGVRDISQELSLWSKENEVIITNQIVADEHVSTQKYSYKALTANGDVCLLDDVIKSAKKVGYKYLTFYSYVKEGKDFDVYLCDVDGEVTNNKSLLSVTHSGRWTYYSVDLSKVEDAGLLFHTNSDVLNLAKVEFVGADITEYAKTIIKESSSAGKSVDLVNGNLTEKIYLSTDNINYSFEYTDTGMDRTSGNDNGDYITFNRSGFYSSYGSTENDVYISSEWIMAAKSLGYSTIGIFVLNSDYNFLKRSIDGTVEEFKNEGKSWHGSVSKFSFISLDLTSFEFGDVIIISSSDTTLGISGVTFRTKAFGVPNLKI